MTTIKWERNSALGGLRLTWDAFVDGIKAGQVVREYRATRRTSNSGLLPNVAVWSVWGSSATFKRLADAKAEAERLIGRAQAAAQK
jgi:hypothetical protein